MFDFVAAMRARDTHASSAAARRRPAADRRPPVHRRQGRDAGGVLPHGQRDHGAGKRLVISADRCPQALDGVEARIVGRMAVGLVADIKAPDLALRRAILGSEARRPARGEGARRGARPARGAHPRQHPRAGGRAQPRRRLCAADRRARSTSISRWRRSATCCAARQRRVTIDEIQKLVSQHFELKPLDLVSARRAPRGGPPAPDRDVSRQAADDALAARDRPQVRRARPFDRDPRGRAIEELRDRTATSTPRSAR